jgi:gamma-glutamyltranspeptidase/glutathione hydrolase
MAAPARPRRLLRKILLVLAIVLVPPIGATAYAVLKLRATVLRSVPAPEAPTGLRAVQAPVMHGPLVVAAHPEAARAGAEVLRNGGSAIDAAIAVQATLTLVEPQSSGLGGGAFLLYYDAPSKKLTAFDGRETAPAAATPKLFLDDKGKPYSFPAALLGGRSVGVPGVVRMLSMVHGRYGKKPWRELFEPAAALADRGFDVTPRLHMLISLDPVMPALPALRGYFFRADGWPLNVGERLANKPLAETLRAVGEGGADAFYTGPIAADIVGTVQKARRPSLTRGAFNLVVRQLGVAAEGEPTVDAPGTLALQDLADYRALEKEPLCVPYHRFRICSAPPPSGGVTVLEVMRLLEPLELSKRTEGSADELALLLGAEALGEADRDRWIGDPAFVQVPFEGLLDEGYVSERRKLLSAERAPANVEAGVPPGAVTATEKGEAFEVPSTSHFVVVDADGSVATMTTSIEFGFGSHLMARGFVLNNQLTDFAFTPEKNGKTVANAVAPGKRPRSAMSPTLVLDENGAPVLAVGSPGGPRIIGYVAQTLVSVLDHGARPSDAIARPHVVYAGGKAEIEDIGWSDQKARDQLAEALKARGFNVNVTSENSGLHAVGWTPDGVLPGIDPRREGVAAAP